MDRQYQVRSRAATVFKCYRSGCERYAVAGCRAGDTRGITSASTGAGHHFDSHGTGELRAGEPSGEAAAAAIGAGELAAHVRPALGDLHARQAGADALSLCT